MGRSVAVANLASPIARKSAGVGLGADPPFSMMPVLGLLNQFAEAGVMHTAERSNSDIIVLVVLMFHSPISELFELRHLPCKIRRLGLHRTAIVETHKTATRYAMDCGVSKTWAWRLIGADLFYENS